MQGGFTRERQIAYFHHLEEFLLSFIDNERPFQETLGLLHNRAKIDIELWTHVDLREIRRVLGIAEPPMQPQKGQILFEGPNRGLWQHETADLERRQAVADELALPLLRFQEELHKAFFLVANAIENCHGSNVDTDNVHSLQFLVDNRFHFNPERHLMTGDIGFYDAPTTRDFDSNGRMVRDWQHLCYSRWQTAQSSCGAFLSAYEDQRKTLKKRPANFYSWGRLASNGASRCVQSFYLLQQVGKSD